ncbi:GNAT family N-acetyltransferase [Brevibacillus daliensis]|uniref:GNAT family N-acetyltransferase n=1 Tax=Brevibacillus daliensis TaxID=2892995 RepID=UPI001E533032|nr:GNAT family N-acetyltransferase [Brevibacillus daliensis]
MNQLTQGAYASKGLNVKEIAGITQLHSMCNDHDQIQIKINQDSLNNRPADQIHDFIHVEDGKVVGFLGLYIFNNKEVEISGMVDPAFRRSGIFTNLLTMAEEEIRNRKIPKMIFMCQEHSHTGKAFLESIGATYSFSEYWMQWNETYGIKKIIQPRIALRNATIDDLPFIMKADTECFNEIEGEISRKFAIDCIEGPSQHVEIALVDNQPIGKIAVMLIPERAFIFAFAVLPEFQGKGYGSEILQTVVCDLQKHLPSKIELEVATENVNALSLYRRCGFEVQSANLYYIKQSDVAKQA